MPIINSIRDLQPITIIPTQVFHLISSHDLMPEFFSYSERIQMIKTVSLTGPHARQDRYYSCCGYGPTQSICDYYLPRGPVDFAGWILCQNGIYSSFRWNSFQGTYRSTAAHVPLTLTTCDYGLRLDGTRNVLKARRHFQAVHDAIIGRSPPPDPQSLL